MGKDGKARCKLKSPSAKVIAGNAWITAHQTIRKFVSQAVEALNLVPVTSPASSTNTQPGHLPRMEAKQSPLSTREAFCVFVVLPKPCVCPSFPAIWNVLNPFSIWNFISNNSLSELPKQPALSSESELLFLDCD